MCVFANGEVDRSPTGSGVSGRMALHFAKNEIEVGESMIVESIIGSTFKCSVYRKVQFGPFEAVIPEVEGRAYIIGQNNLYIDPVDPFKHGFMLR